MPGEHAKLSASGAYRWLACPPSAMLEAELPESTSSYAEEGTRAHDLAEGRLTAWLRHKKRPKAEDAEMEEAVSRYVDVVLERYAEAVGRSPDAVLLVEQRLDFSAWVPEGFGTGDAVIIADDTLEVVDLKYGKGVPVGAKGNPQMRLYALGAYQTYGALYDFTKVRMTIVQPRLDSVDTDEVGVGELLDWAENEVRPKARAAWEGGGEFAAGDHCKFCKLKATCRARAEKNLELAAFDFAPPPTLSPEEIADILKRADELAAWARDVQEHALDQAQNHGVKYPGWKLVEGRSNRKIADEDAAALVLMAEGYGEQDVWRRSLQTLTELEKLVGKKKLGELLADQITKPAGKPVLVPEDDKRPEMSSVAGAQADFTE